MTLVKELRKKAAEWAKRDDPDNGRYTASEAFERAAKMVEADPLYRDGPGLLRDALRFQDSEGYVGQKGWAQKVDALLATLPTEG